MDPLGYVKIFRRLKKKAWYKKSKYVHVWIHILMNVNHKEADFLFINKMIQLKPGQLVTGRKQLSAELGISQTTITRILEIFEKDGQIKQQTTNKFRIITVVNWGKYQEKTENGQQPSAAEIKQLSDAMKRWAESNGFNTLVPENLIGKHGFVRVSAAFKKFGNMNNSVGLFMASFRKNNGQQN